MKNLLGLLYFLLSGLLIRAQPCPVIPAPDFGEYIHQQVTLDEGWQVIGNDSLQDAVTYFTSRLKQDLNLRLPAGSETQGQINRLKRIVFRCDNKVGEKNGYILKMAPDQIVIRACNKTGIMYGANSLLQILLFGGQSANRGLTAPCWNLEDAPAFTWRGLMLDESRHFFGREVVEHLLDMMALYKLNVFHWHLTDEPGWRIEIKSFPLLTSVGGRGDATDSGKKPQFYTQAEIREIVHYATVRGITVIPEIDLPGHASAAIRAYPVFSGGGSAAHPDFTFNPGLDTTYGFLSKIFKEVAGLFPSKIIHIGGDEVSFGNENWNTDPAILSLKSRFNLKRNKDVEQYFVGRIADSIYKMGCRVAGWDEIADAALQPDKTIVMWWRHDHPEQLQKAIARGFQVVLMPRLPFYFDFVQTDRDRAGRRWKKSFNTLEDVYAFDPDSLVAPQNRRQVEGTEAALWTEQIASPERLYYMLFPRICALAENAWTGNNGGSRDYLSFLKQINGHMDYWQKHGFGYFNVSDPDKTPEVLDGQRPVNYLDNAK